MSSCLCGSGKSFDACCKPLLDGEREANGPEELMRSRFAAFCVKDIDYVLNTTDPQARIEMDESATKDWMDRAEFTKLEVLSSKDEGNKGTVEFKAYFKMDGVEEIHHEISKFRKQAGTWYFRDGRVLPTKP